MESQECLLYFLNKMAKDPRMSKAHLAVYMALFYLWSKQDFNGPIAVYSREIQTIAKISYSGTYYAVMKQLNAYSYLRYTPSYYPKHGSQVDLNVMAIQKEKIL